MIVFSCSLSSDDSDNDSSSDSDGEDSSPENIDDPFATISNQPDAEGKTAEERKEEKKRRKAKKKKKKHRYREVEDDDLADATQLYDCVVCKDQFGSQKKLEVHVLRAHPGEKPYKCPLCGLGLTRMTTYKEHMNTHTVVAVFFWTINIHFNFILLYSRAKNRLNAICATKSFRTANHYNATENDTIKTSPNNVICAKQFSSIGTTIKSTRLFAGRRPQTRKHTSVLSVARV